MTTPYSSGLTCTLPTPHPGPYFQNNDTCNNLENVSSAFLSFVPCPPPFMNVGEFRSNVSGLEISEKILLVIITICNIPAEPVTPTTPILTSNRVTNITMTTATTEKVTDQTETTNRTTHINMTTATPDFPTTTIKNQEKEQVHPSVDQTHITAMANQEGTVVGMCFGLGFLVVIFIMYKKHNANAHDAHSDAQTENVFINEGYITCNVEYVNMNLHSNNALIASETDSSTIETPEHMTLTPTNNATNSKHVHFQVYDDDTDM